MVCHTIALPKPATASQPSAAASTLIPSGLLRESALTMTCALTMRLSDAGLRCRPTKLIYPHHRLPPWHNEDAPRDRSNRWLGALVELCAIQCDYHFNSKPNAY